MRKKKTPPGTLQRSRRRGASNVTRTRDLLITNYRKKQNEEKWETRKSEQYQGFPPFLPIEKK